MCLAIPGKIVEFHEKHGVRMSKVDFGGITREACLEYLPEAQLGDYVLVHVGFAISKVDEAEAAKTFQYLREMDQLAEVIENFVVQANRDPRHARFGSHDCPAPALAEIIFALHTRTVSSSIYLPGGRLLARA